MNMKLVYVVLACFCVYAALAEGIQPESQMQENDKSNEMLSNVADSLVGNEKPMEQVGEESQKNDGQLEEQEDILSQDEILNALRDDSVVENDDTVDQKSVESSISKV